MSEGPPGLHHPSKPDDKTSSKRKTSESSKIQLELKPRLGFRKSRGQAQKLLLSEKRSSRKRKAEDKDEPPKKKPAPVKPGNVIGAVRESANGWQVRTAEGVILDTVFSSKKEAEDVLRSLQKGETTAADYQKSSSKSDRKDDSSHSRKSKKKSKKKERDRERDRDRDREREKEKKEKSNELDDDLLEDSVNSKDPASSVQLQKRRERLLKWKQDKLEQSILAKVQNVDLESMIKEVEVKEPKKPSPKPVLSDTNPPISPEPSQSASPRKTMLTDVKRAKPIEPAEKEKETLFKPKPRSSKHEKSDAKETGSRKESRRDRDRSRDRGRRRRRDRDRDRDRTRAGRRRDRRSERKRRVRGSDSDDDERETKKAKKEAEAAAIPAETKQKDPPKEAEKSEQAKKNDKPEKAESRDPEPTKAAAKERFSKSPSPAFPLEFAFENWIPERDGTRDVDKCYKRLNTISEGVYGVVHRCIDRETNEMVALKKIKLYKTQSGFPLSSLREIGILLDLDHPNIVKVREVVVSETTADVFMVMEYAHNCMQNLIIQQRVEFSTGQVKTLMHDLLTGLNFMHKKWYLHRDLKTANLLYTNDGYLKICDYGMARQFGMPLAPYTNLVVTPWYRAPELLLGTEIYGPAIDVWSCGCIFAEIFMKKVLFHGKGELNQIELIFELLGTPNEEIWPKVSDLPHWGKFKLQEYPGKFDDIFTVKKVEKFELSESGKDFLHKLLWIYPEKRLTAEEALKHAWFTEEPLPVPHEKMPDFQEFNTRELTEERPPPKAVAGNRMGSGDVNPSVNPA